MPNSKSAIKRMRSDARKRLRNQAALTELKTLSKRLVLTAQSNPEQAKQNARFLIGRYDKAVLRGIIPHGLADRRKARIAKLIARKAVTPAPGNPKA